MSNAKHLVDIALDVMAELRARPPKTIEDVDTWLATYMAAGEKARAEAICRERLCEAAPELLIVAERMAVGITKKSTPTCEWYEGIEWDAADEFRAVYAKATGSAS